MSRISRIACLALIPVLVFSCKKSEPTTSTTAQTTTATVTPAPQPAPTTETTATVVSAPAGRVIASTEGEREGARVEITELKRASGGNVNLRFSIVNSSAKEFNMATYLGDSGVSTDYYRGVSGIHLIDPVNKKKYFVVTDAEKKCVCSKDVEDVKPGGRVSLWAKFPAPPPEVQKVTIEIPHFQPIDDVPISQ